MDERLKDLLTKLVGTPIEVEWSNGMFSIVPPRDRLWKIESVGEDFVFLTAPNGATQKSGAYAICFLRYISAELIKKERLLSESL
jgi:hypothetical protein